MFWNANNGKVLIGDTHMSYVSFGYGDQALVILPGLSDGLTSVEGKALMLAYYYKDFCRKYKIYIFSRKDTFPDPYSIQDMADDQAEAMGKLAIKYAFVMGVSQGGMIAQALTMDHPDLVQKLIIAVSAPRTNERIEACISRWIDLVKRGDHKGFMVDVIEKTYSEVSLAKYRRLYPIMGLIWKPTDYTRFFISAQAILEFNVLDQLKSITCPVLILGGGTDQIVGIEGSYEMHERISNSFLHVYSELGHAAYEEAKDFNQRVIDFLG